MNRIKHTKTTQPTLRMNRQQVPVCSDQIITQNLIPYAIAIASMRLRQQINGEATLS